MSLMGISNFNLYIFRFVVFNFFWFLTLVFANDSLNKTFLMPSIQVSSISQFKNADYNSQPFSLMGMLIGTHHFNYKWSSSLLSLIQLEKASSEIDYDYSLFQGSLNYQLKKNIKIQISTGPFNYQDRINNTHLTSFFVKSNCQYFFSPSRFIQLGLKKNQLDYNNASPKTNKYEYSLNFYPNKHSFYSPFYGISYTDSDSSTSYKLSTGISSYFKKKHSASLRLSHSKTNYTQSSSRTNDLSLSYAYRLSNSSSLIINQEISALDDDSTYTFAIAYSYFGSFNQKLKKGNKNTLLLLLKESKQAINQKNYHKAKNILATALYHYPSNIRSRMQLAFVYHHLHQESLSNEQLSYVLSQYPDRLDAIYLQARNHINLSNFKQALNLLNTIYNQNKDDEVKKLIVYVNKQLTQK